MELHSSNINTKFKDNGNTFHKLQYQEEEEEKKIVLIPKYCRNDHHPWITLVYLSLSHLKLFFREPFILPSTA